MSTTVTYKGETIATVSNSTKTLQTEGTWLEDDITLTDVSGGGGSPVIQSLSVTSNGTYTAPTGVDGYSPVSVNVSGGITPTGTLSISANGTYDVTNYASADVSVSGGSGYSIDDLARGEPTGSISISEQTIAAYAFYKKTGLTSVTASSTKIDGYAFGGCSGLTSISFPNCTTFSSAGYQFSGCTGLTSVAFPSLTSSIYTRCFEGCSNLVTADLGSTSGINNQAFINSSKLRNIVLRSSTVVTLAAWNAVCLAGIYNNPAESTIYVPSSLISSYQSASNWSSAYSSGVTFSAIEGSVYE